MDNNTSIFQERRDDSKLGGFSLLTPVKRDPSDGDELAFLWSKVQTEDYAFDDHSRGRLDYFLCMIANMNDEFFRIGDHGLVLILHPIEGGTAEFHFIIWDREYSLYKDKDAIIELFDWLFYGKKVHRLQGSVPVYNKLANRFAFSLGFKYEGELRQAVLWHGTYYDVKMFGLLREDYERWKERVIQ